MPQWINSDSANIKNSVCHRTPSRKRKPTKQEKIPANHISDKDLVVRIYKEFLK